MTAGTETTFRADAMADLTALLVFVDAACDSAGPDAGFPVRLAVEEVFTNIQQHGYRSRGGPVRVAVEADGARVRVVIEDDAPPFDPDDAPAPDVASNADRREPGGLGWHLVRELMDEVGHAPREPRGNTYTLVKRLPVAAP